MSPRYLLFKFELKLRFADGYAATADVVTFDGLADGAGPWCSATRSGRWCACTRSA
ncbi:hypothetical protein [Amycolatopsis sp. lyj-23]|uniref:hypothetical protein n=1 Tax=Amycolatopsis sp. lyj-23 TaxID=2789283 RepID=UPI00397902FA